MRERETCHRVATKAINGPTKPAVNTLVIATAVDPFMILPRSGLIPMTVTCRRKNSWRIQVIMATLRSQPNR